MIIDMHAHIGNVPYTKRLFTSDDLVKSMDRVGIALSVVSQLSNYVKEDNDAAAEAARKYPSRLMGFAHIDPKYGEDALQELDRAVKTLKLRGVKFHPSADGYRAYDEIVLRVMERVEKYKLPTLWHTGPYSIHSMPLHVAYVAREFPKIPFILGHMGLTAAVEAVPAAKLSDNIYLETSACAETTVIEWVVREVGAERVVWGSDQPAINPLPELKKIEVLEIDEKEKQMILWENATKILEIRNLVAF